MLVKEEGRVAWTAALGLKLVARMGCYEVEVVYPFDDLSLPDSHRIDPDLTTGDCEPAGSPDGFMPLSRVANLKDGAVCTGIRLGVEPRADV